MVPALSDRFATLVDDGEGKDEETSKAMPAAAPAEKTTKVGSKQAKQENSASPPTASSDSNSALPKDEAMDATLSEPAPLAVAGKSVVASKTEPRSVNSPATSEVSMTVAAETKVASVVTTVENTAASAVAAAAKRKPAKAAKTASEIAQEFPKELPAASEPLLAADIVAQDSGEPKPIRFPLRFSSLSRLPTRQIWRV